MKPYPPIPRSWRWYCPFCRKFAEDHYVWRDEYLHHEPERWRRRG